MTNASLDSFIEGSEDGSLRGKQKAMYRHIRSNPNCTIYTLREALGYGYSTISSAISQLVDRGYIRVSGEVTNAVTNRKNSVYQAADNIPVRKNKKQRKAAAIDKFRLFYKPQLSNVAATQVYQAMLEAIQSI